MKDCVRLEHCLSGALQRRAGVFRFGGSGPVYHDEKLAGLDSGLVFDCLVMGNAQRDKPTCQSAHAGAGDCPGNQPGEWS